jgi:hypothetical protein
MMPFISSFAAYLGENYLLANFLAKRWGLLLFDFTTTVKAPFVRRVG